MGLLCAGTARETAHSNPSAASGETSEPNRGEDKLSSLAKATQLLSAGAAWYRLLIQCPSCLPELKSWFRAWGRHHPPAQGGHNPGRPERTAQSLSLELCRRSRRLAWEQPDLRSPVSPPMNALSPAVHRLEGLLPSSLSTLHQELETSPYPALCKRSPGSLSACATPPPLGAPSVAFPALSSSGTVYLSVPT
jgi:hypothetical protein